MPASILRTLKTEVTCHGRDNTFITEEHKRRYWQALSAYPVQVKCRQCRDFGTEEVKVLEIGLF